ncbi:hypothetical protein H5T52_05675 [Candidatus Bipolaricaulota bacterium]|nr:hypothetical protein [Candidatus Bipolaricaulota bacterium]
MSRRRWLWLVPLLVATVGWAQAELADFPEGITTMTWRLKGKDLPAAQSLSLAVEGLPEGRYRVRLSVEAEGFPDELGMLGFLGSAFYIQSAGAGLDLGALMTLIRRRELLKVGEEYALPGGILFRALEKIRVAGVDCLLGQYTQAGSEGSRVELGLALSDPVYLVPWLRVYEGEEIAFEMVLIEYKRP